MTIEDPFTFRLHDLLAELGPCQSCFMFAKDMRDEADLLVLQPIVRIVHCMHCSHGNLAYLLIVELSLRLIALKNYRWDYFGSKVKYGVQNKWPILVIMRYGAILIIHLVRIQTFEECFTSFEATKQSGQLKKL